MVKKKLLTCGMILYFAACGMLINNGKEAEASCATPSIVGNEKVIYLDSNDKIAIQGKRVVSVKYSSSKKKVAVINKKGKISPKKKGKTTIKAEVVYRKKAGGKKYTKKLSYKLQVYGKAKEYFKYVKRDKYSCMIMGLTKKGEKLTKIYLPEVIQKDSVTYIGAYAFDKKNNVEELYLSDNLEAMADSAIRYCSSLKVISIGKDFAPEAYQDCLFGGCGMLERIELDNRNKNFKLENGVLISGNDLWCYPAQKAEQAYEIPSDITSINGHAFEKCKSLKQITLHDNITNFGTKCFAGSGLTSITFPDEVDSVAYGMFQNCTDLAEVILSKRMKLLETYMFQNCDSLKEIMLPVNMYSVNGTAFADCDNLININVSTINEKLKAFDGVLYNKAGTRLMVYPPGRKETSYYIKDGTKVICLAAFYAVPKLESAVLPKTVTEIANYAFYKSGIKEIVIPDNVNRIGWDAFGFCTKLVDVKLPKNLSSIDYRAFRSCKSLTSITLPKEMIDFENSLFVGCDKLVSVNVDEENTRYVSVDGVVYSKSKETLYYYPVGKKDTSFTIPSTVRNIKANAFYGTKYLKHIIVPDEVRSFENDAFYGCSSLESIVLPKKIDRMVWPSFENCSSLKKISIPEGCDVIKSSAFRNCTSLKEVIMPNSVTRIENYSFENCSSLKRITMSSNITRIGKSAFANCIRLKGITLGKKVNLLRSEAFYNCKALKKIECKLKKLHGLTYGADVFTKTGANNYKKLVVKVPKGKKKAYTKLFQKMGLSKKAKIKE